MNVNTIFFFLCLFGNGLLFAQSAEIKCIENPPESPLYTAKQQKPGLWKLIYKDGRIEYMNLRVKYKKDYPEEAIDTTTISLWEIDTTALPKLYKFWKDIPVSDAPRGD